MTSSVPSITTGFVFVSRLPSAYRSIFTIFMPFDWKVWMAALIALSVFIWVLTFVSRIEERLTGRTFRQWSTPSRASWYAFGTLIGESITRDTKSEGSWALRILIGIWILTAFILSAGYGGNLRAFLLSPSFEVKMVQTVQVLITDVCVTVLRIP